MTRRHTVREHPRRTAAGATVVSRHGRGDGMTHNRAVADAALLAIRLIGSCQICEADHKLDERERVVHHGYLRPGDGRIHGDCMGVDEPPYEVSCDRCVVYLAGLRRHAAELREAIARFASPSMTTFTRTKPGLRRLDPPVTTTYTKGVTPNWEWNQELRGVQGELRMAHDGVLREVDRIEKRIAAWTPKPIRTVEELIRREAARKAERAAVQQAREETRQATERAKQAKRDALAAKKQAAIEAVRTTIRDLARRKAAGENVEKAAARITNKVHSAPFVQLCRYDVANTLNDVRHEAVAIGAARVDARGNVAWGYY